ncbi:Folate-biopterin transporter 1, chloroplastic, partial [Mucuna pruriens]
MENFGRSGSFIRLNSDNDDPFLGSRISVGERNALTIEMDPEAASSIKKLTYPISSIKLFGVDLSPSNIVVVVVYFVQGVLRLARRSYLVLSGLLGSLSWSLMAIFVDNKYNIQRLWKGHVVSHEAPQDLFSLYVRQLYNLTLLCYTLPQTLLVLPLEFLG